MLAQYQDLTSSVVGSGAMAVRFLPPGLKLQASKSLDFKFPEEIVHPGKIPFWREGIRLTSEVEKAKDLKYKDLYSDLLKIQSEQALKQLASKQKQAEFAGLGALALDNKYAVAAGALLAVAIGLKQKMLPVKLNAKTTNLAIMLLAAGAALSGYKALNVG